MMALKIVSLGRGASGVRREVIEQLQAMLARRVYPLVPQQGSVGASGDLAPLAHMTAVMIGEGQAIVDGKTVSGQRGARRGRPGAADARPQGGARADQRHAVLDRLRHLRRAARISPGPRRARHRRAVGRCGDGLDGAVPPRDPGAARPSRADRRGRDADGAARRQRHPPVASRRRRARAGSLLPALPAAGRGRRARPDHAGRAHADRRGQCRHRQSAGAGRDRRDRLRRQFPRRAGRLCRRHDRACACRRSARSASGASRRWSIPRSISACRRS